MPATLGNARQMPQVLKSDLILKFFENHVILGRWKLTVAEPGAVEDTESCQNTC